jgi:hypothetical protein
MGEAANMRELKQEELERLAAFVLGVLAGLVLIGITASLVEDWVIASDLADRRRIREIVRQELAGRAQAAAAAEELARAAAELPAGSSATNHKKVKSMISDQEETAAAAELPLA